MLLNLSRINMALKHTKRTTNYLLKLKSSIRKEQHFIVKATSLLFEVEKLIRSLQQSDKDKNL